MAKVKVLRTQEECWIYLNRLGLIAGPGFPGWIPQAQKEMCDLSDALLLASGQSTWATADDMRRWGQDVTRPEPFRPFKVRYHRPASRGWYGLFTVEKVTGENKPMKRNVLRVSDVIR